MLEALLGDKTKLSVGAAEDFRIPHGLIFSTKFPFFTDVLHSPPLFPFCHIQQDLSISTVTNVTGTFFLYFLRRTAYRNISETSTQTS